MVARLPLTHYSSLAYWRMGVKLRSRSPAMDENHKRISQQPERHWTSVGEHEKGNSRPSWQRTGHKLHAAQGELGK